jgi:hypothetical protein
VKRGRKPKAALQEDHSAPVTVTLSSDDWKTLRLALSVWLWTYEGSTDPTMAKMASRIRKMRDQLEAWRPADVPS